MASTLAAMKGHLGSTDYYTFVMKAGELIARVRIPKDIPGWDHLSFEERYQREINYTRVRGQIARYFANDKDRFFGALIVSAIPSGNEAPFHWRPLSEEVGNKLHPSYRDSSHGMGFLTLPGSTTLVPLDGQHRLKAIEFAISGLDNRGKGIPGIESNPELANEDLTVMMLPGSPLDSEEAPVARRIFTKVNLYARKPTTGETIATNDEDYSAVIARETANQLDARLVRIEGSTLPASSKEFTTLATLQSCVLEIVKAKFPGKIDRSTRPDDDKMGMYSEAVRDVWTQLLNSIDVFRSATADIENKDGGDERRRMIRKESLLGKPAAQECVVRAYLRLVGHPTNMTPKEACERLNLLPWALTEEHVSRVWQNILWIGGAAGRIITGTGAKDVGSRLMAYMAGEELTGEQRAELEGKYLSRFPETERKERVLPPVVEISEQG